MINCICHCTVTRAAFCKLEKAAQDSQNPTHDEAARLLQRVLAFAERGYLSDIHPAGRR